MPLPGYLTALRNLVQTDISGTGIPATTVVGPDAFGDAAVVGVSTNFAREDHNHGLPASPTLGAATSVVGPDAYGAAAIVGVSTRYARQDHDHGLPAATGGTPAISVVGPDALNSAAVVGVSLNYARQDHDHGLPAVAGATPATTVTGVPAFGDSKSVGTSLLYARQDHIHGLPAEQSLATINSQIATMQAQIAALQNPPGGGGGGGLGTIGVFPGTYGNSMSGFLNALADMSIDTLEIVGGTYSAWHDLAINVDRTSRPLLVRPQGTGDVIWSGNGGSGDGLMYIGWSSKCAWLTFDSAGSGNLFKIQSFDLTQTGLITLDWAENVTFNGFNCTLNTASTTNGQTAWWVYSAGDGTHGGKNQTFNNWTGDNSTGAANHRVNGCQFNDNPGSVGFTCLNWTINSGRWGFVGRNSATGGLVSGWTITNVEYKPFDSQGPAGTVKNMTSTGSGGGAPIINSPMTDGGGNSWS